MPRQLAKNLHAFSIHAELRRLRDRRALSLNMQPEFRGKLEDGMRKYILRYVVLPFALIPDMYQAMVYAHFELCGGRICATLVGVELLETLQR